MNGTSSTTLPIDFVFNNTQKLIREVFFVKNEMKSSLNPLKINYSGNFAKTIYMSCKDENKNKIKKSAYEYFDCNYQHNKDISRFRKSQVNGIANLKLKDYKKNKRIISYFSSSEDEFLSVRLQDCKESDWNQFEAICALVNIVKNIPDTILCIRLHPNLKNKKYRNKQEFKKLCIANKIIVFDFNSAINSIELIELSETNIFWDSTLVEDSAYRKKKNILLNKYFYKDLPLGLFASNKDELEKALFHDDYKLELSKEIAEKIAFYRTNEGISLKYLKELKNRKYIFSI
tara:strand:- start:2424 stop:3290 length:867 start_codon:yes stop_codon:yes gene_type:complete